MLGFTQLVSLAAVSSTLLLVDRVKGDVVPTAPGPGDTFNVSFHLPLLERSLVERRADTSRFFLSISLLSCLFGMFGRKDLRELSSFLLFLPLYAKRGLTIEIFFLSSSLTTRYHFHTFLQIAFRRIIFLFHFEISPVARFNGTWILLELGQISLFSRSFLSLSLLQILK